MSTSVRICSVAGKLCSKEYIFFSSKRDLGEIIQGCYSNSEVPPRTQSPHVLLICHPLVFTSAFLVAARHMQLQTSHQHSMWEEGRRGRGQWKRVNIVLSVPFQTFFFFLFLGYRFYLLICFWLCWVFIAGGLFPLVVVNSSYSPVAVHRLLIAVAFVAEHRLGHMDFSSCSSWAPEHRFSSCGTRA